MERPNCTRLTPGYTRTINKLLLAVVSATSVGFQIPAWSQGMLEEVVVTARKREESLQEIPIAVTAFSGAKLEESGIKNISDFNEVVPNLDVGDGSGNAGVANIYIRGVGQRNTEPNLDSGVATYIDGVYVGRADGALLDVNDIQSVQVLRGPQGTLFGKNATGGAMVFNTNRPGPELEGGLTVRAGNYEQRDAEGYLNIPLVDDLLYTRLSVVSKQRDGYIHNVVDDSNYNDVDRISGVWQVRWLATDDLTIDFNANYGKTAQTARLQKCVVVDDDEVQGRAWQTNASNASVIAAYNKDIRELCTESEVLGTYEVTSDIGGSYDAENQGFSTTIDWGLTETLSFKSITAWRGTKANQDDELDQLSIPLLHRSNSAHPIAQERVTDQYSQELQLLGDAFDGQIEWVAGLYGFIEKTGQSRTVNQVGPIHYLPPAANKYLYNTFATDLAVDNSAYSAFTQADWSISDSWVLTAGLRYTSEKRELTKTLYSIDLDTLTLGGATIDGIVEEAIYVLSEDNALNYNHEFIVDPSNPAESASISDDSWTPLLSLKYLLPEGDLINGGSVFLTLSQGYRSGGLSEAPRPCVENCTAPSDERVYGASIQQFEPEEVDNIELGIKLDTWENRMRINASVFHMAYENRQLTTVVFDTQNGLPGGATINAKESTISGIELETTLLPIDGLEITINATWNKGEIDEYEDIQILGYGVVDGVDYQPVGTEADGCQLETIILSKITSCTIDRSDEDLPRLSKRNFMVAMQYTFDTEYGTITPRIQGSWKFDTELCFDRSSCESGQWYSDKQTNISARLTWMSPEAQWRVSAFGTNLTKEDYQTGGTSLVDALGYGGQTYANPRMIGAEAAYTF